MRKTLIGTVVSDKRNKTRRVDVQRLYQHPKYGKIVRGRTVCQVHDEKNESHLGDEVEIIESRPYSKTKRWELVRIVKASTDVARQARAIAEVDVSPADVTQEEESAEEATEPIEEPTV